jgi:hypothetical protein
MIHLDGGPDDYAAILSFARSAKASALALLLRHERRAELAVTPYWRLPSNDTVELRIVAADGSLAFCRYSAKDGVVREPVVDTGLLATLLPRAAARLFAVALEAEQLTQTVAAGLQLSAREPAPAV